MSKEKTSCTQQIVFMNKYRYLVIIFLCVATAILGFAGLLTKDDHFSFASLMSAIGAISHLWIGYEES